MDFAPYQSSPPETQRQFSPPVSQTASPRASLDAAAGGRRSFSPNVNVGAAGSNFNADDYLNRPSPPPLQHPQPQRQWGSLPNPASFPNFRGNSSGEAEGRDDGGIGRGFGGDYSGGIGGYYGNYRDGVSEFDTSLGIRLDYEACLAYLVFPPVGGILLLILERKSDYVRFHAWQSSLLFTTVFIFHLLFSWSTFLSWFILVGDLVLMAWLTFKAYQDADTLDRYEVPLFGAIASRILDDE